MKPYDSAKSLIFIHIPRCGGTSLIEILKKWFGKKYYRQTFKENKNPPPEKLTGGICISGHFNKRRQRGVIETYPEGDQFFTILRDPYELALSQYFFWKKKRRRILLEREIITEGGPYDYRDINYFFKMMPRSYLLDFMPVEMTVENYKEVIEKYFVYIGIMEEYQVSVNQLAAKLGFPTAPIGHLNSSVHNEEVLEEVKEEFLQNNQLEYLIYNHIKSFVGIQGGGFGGGTPSLLEKSPLAAGGSL